MMFNKEEDEMATKKTPEPASGQREQAASHEAPGRKPWRKKTAPEMFATQLDKLRAEIEKEESELDEKKRTLQKLEEAIKVFER